MPRLLIAAGPVVVFVSRHRAYADATRTVSVYANLFARARHPPAARSAIEVICRHNSTTRANSSVALSAHIPCSVGLPLVAAMRITKRKEAPFGASLRFSQPEGWLVPSYANPAVTLKVYAHLFARAKHAAAARSALETGYAAISRPPEPARLSLHASGQ